MTPDDIAARITDNPHVFVEFRTSIQHTCQEIDVFGDGRLWADAECEIEYDVTSGQQPSWGHSGGDPGHGPEARPVAVHVYSARFMNDSGMPITMPLTPPVQRYLEQACWHMASDRSLARQAIMAAHDAQTYGIE